MSNNSNWPPEGFVAVGDYAFEPPLVPTLPQVEQAEQFVFTQPVFENIDEIQRRRNVIRLAIAAATNYMLGETEDSRQNNYVPLIGGVVLLKVERHEGSPIITYSLLEG